jgi:hypothetical protein
MALELLFDAAACDRQQQRYPQYDTICGSCIWACPFTSRGLRDTGPGRVAAVVHTDEGGIP